MAASPEYTEKDVSRVWAETLEGDEVPPNISCFHEHFRSGRVLPRGKSLWVRYPWLPPLLVALVLRLATLHVRPLWYDEAFGVLLARQGWEGIATATWRALLQGQRAEHHTPLFYLMLWGWIRLFGDSVLAVRLMAVVWGMVAWVLAWKLAHRWLAPDTARLAAWLVAVSPFQVHYAQEARMYSMLIAAALGWLWSLEEALRRRGLRWWAALAGFGALLLYTHNAAVLYLSVWVPWGLWRASRVGKVRQVLAALLAVALLYLPWAWVLRVQVGHVRQAYWIRPPNLATLLNTLLAFTVHVPMPGGVAVPAFALTLFLVAVGLWHTLRAWRAGTAVPGPVLLAMLSAWVWFFLFSQWFPVYLVRLLAPVGVLFLFWLAWALVEAAPRAAIGRGLLALWMVAAALGMYVHATYRGFPYAPYRALAMWLKARSTPDTWIVHSNKITYLPMVYVAPDLDQMYLPDPPGSGSDTLSPMMQKGLGIPAPLDPESLDGHFGPLWFLVFEKEIADYASMGRPHPYLRRLRARFCAPEPQPWGDLLVYAFRPCP